jgi:signal transduction histidine kinase
VLVVTGAIVSTILERRSAHPITDILNWWSSRSLARQFALLSSVLVLIGLGILGYWVSQKIEEGIKLEIANRAELYMASFITPLVQTIGLGDELSFESKEKIATALSNDSISLSVKEVKIWSLAGKILYGSNKALTGKLFPITPELVEAAAGRTAIDFDEEAHSDHEVAGVTEVNRNLFEIYIPLRDSKTRKVFAIGEFYQDASIVRNAIYRAQLESWLVTGLVSLGLIAGLYQVVASGSRLIERQSHSLDERVQQLTELLRQNEQLRARVQHASQLSNQDLEIHLRRIGADLHDGIGQLLTIVMLRIDRVFGKNRGTAELTAVKEMLGEAMKEIRNLSVGLALPEIEKLPLNEAIQLIVARHERATSTKVTVNLIDAPLEPSHPIKLCLCRVVQEALNNSFKHADGVGQNVTTRWNGSTVTLCISDRGPGFTVLKPDPKRQALGLIGLRNRLESLGGQLSVKGDEGKGTVLNASLFVNS